MTTQDSYTGADPKSNNSYLYHSLVHYVIKANHDAVYAAHAGVKRTCDLIALSFWWPGMRKSVQEYVQKSE